jgi:nucleoside-diphosphate-sugar epimerase
MRFLVTGGAGFIGSNTVDELVRREHHVVVFDDLSTGKAENLSRVVPKVEILQHSILELDQLREACRGIDYVIHLAARTSVPQSMADPLDTNRVNVEGTLNVLIAAREANVKRVVFAGSTAVYGNTLTLPTSEFVPPAPLSPYGASKLAGETYGQVFARSYGLEFVSLRYFNVFGPRQDPGSPYSGVLSQFGAAILGDTQPVVYGDGEQSRDFVYVRNVVEANLLACEAKTASGLAINIGTGARHTLNQTLTLLEKVTGKSTRAKYAAPREGDIRDSQADISRARNVLGYSPEIGFEEGLSNTWEWFCAKQGAACSA